MIFQWSRLEAGSIRLVRFLPYSTPSNLYLALEHRSKYWDEAVHYTALSYVHGDRSDRKPITLAGRSFMITANLHAALAALYARGDLDQWLWVDQLCLNHQNITEKSSQVAQMGAIYASAGRVVAWLRPDADLVASAPIEAGAEIRNDQLPTHGQESSTRPEVGLTIPAIARHSHWQRAWTRVEARRARELEVMYGGHVINAEVVSSVQDSTHDQENISTYLLERSSDKYASSGSVDLAPAGGLKDIVREYSGYTSSNVLDRVFAMLSDPRLDKVPSKHRPWIDYGITPADLATGLTSWYDDICQISHINGTWSSYDHRESFCSYVAIMLDIS